MKNIKKNNSILQGLRLFVQIGFFIFLPSLYVQALNGVRQIFSAIIDQNFSAALLPQTIEIIALIPVTIVLGRFFCGWMCGFGSFTDFIYLISSKVWKKKIKVNEQVDAFLKYIKYGVLVVLSVVIWNLNLTIFNSTSPWDAFGMIAIIGKTPDFSYVISNLLIGFLLFLMIIIASVFVERFFCRYLCPMGAVFAITSKLRIGKIKKPSEKCGNCRICTNNCAMGIALYKTDVVNSAECINCMKCVTVCPRHNTTYTIAKNDVRPLLVSAVSVAIMTGSYYTSDYVINAASNSNTESNQTSETTSTNQIYNDGIFQGTGIGFRNGTTTVEVTIENDKITDISAISYEDDRPYFSRAFSTVADEIIYNQSSDVDAVSGATYSSNGIMEAVSDALSQAKIQESSSTAIAEADSTSQDTDVEIETTQAPIVEETDAETYDTETDDAETYDAETDDTETTATAAPTIVSVEEDVTVTSGNYKDGTYQGSGTGFRRGTTTVSVVVSDGKIASIDVYSYEDDAPYFNSAFPIISEEIISSQSTNVDGVSGATYSSNGIMEAVANALEGAME